jgi:hypothetical protein
MKYIYLFLLVVWFFYGCGSSPEEESKDTGKKKLQIILEENTSGVVLQDICYGEYTLLKQPGNLFQLSLQSEDNRSFTLESTKGWEEVTIVKTENKEKITLKNPTENDLPDTLEVSVTIQQEEKHSIWDIQVDGLGKECSLMDISFPLFHIKAEGDDTFFLPYYYGKLIHNPAKGIMYDLIYPRGLGATMQYLSYYNQNYGIYFGFADPKASLKHFVVKAERGGVNVGGVYPAENKTVMGNAWHLPGSFVLHIFDGDWYDAALLYKNWVSKEADYFPKDTPQRLARQKKFASIGIWAQEHIDLYLPGEIESHLRDFRDFMQMPVAITWTKWFEDTNKEFDRGYPDIFYHEKEGLESVIGHLKGRYGDTILLSLYINGRLYDQNLSSYRTVGIKAAAKKGDGTPYTYRSKSFGRLFSVMCPTRTEWQEKVIGAVRYSWKDLVVDGDYIDQVAAARAVECMDKRHGHPLGGGHYWRDGYKEMFSKLHRIDPCRFLTSEGACDFIADEVDGFLSESYVTSNQVPALQVVYGGKVQFYGTHTGWSDYKPSDAPDSQRFYAKYARSFCYGVQPGRVWMGLVQYPDNRRTAKAANFLKKLASLHLKYKDFFSFGEMVRPLVLEGKIPELIFRTIGANGEWEDVHQPAIQSSVYKSGEKVLLLFVNGTVSEKNDSKIDFSFSFDARKYGLKVPLEMKEISEDGEGGFESVLNPFCKEIVLKEREVRAYLVQQIK